MGKKIIFQKCNFNYIYFLFNIIMTFINLLIEYKLYPGEESELDESEDKYFLPIQILNYLYTYNISDFIAVIPYLIRKRILKKKELNIFDTNTEDNNIHTDESNSNLIYTNSEKSDSKKKKKEILLRLIIISVFDFLHKFVLILFNIIFPENVNNVIAFSCTIQLEIVFQFICSYFILKIHFYKLQYLSLYLNLGIFIILLIFDIIIVSQSEIFDGKVYYFMVSGIIFYCIEYSLVKKILLYGFISIYYLMLIKGLFVLFFVIVFSVIIFLVKKDISPIFVFFLTTKKYILLMIAKIFSNFFLSMFLWLIIDRFSPNYLPFSLIFNEIIYFIVDVVYNKKTYKTINWDLYLRIVLYAISFIGVMIHNEIVVINICNLGSDTKYFLDLKLENEELFTNTDNLEILKRYETFEMDSVNEEDNEEQINNEKETPNGDEK